MLRSERPAMRAVKGRLGYRMGSAFYGHHSVYLIPWKGVVLNVGLVT